MSRATFPRAFLHVSAAHATPATVTAQAAVIALALGLRRDAVARAFARGPNRVRLVAMVLGKTTAEVIEVARPMLDAGATLDAALDYVLVRATERSTVAA